MSSNSTMPMYRVINMLRTSESCAFRFVDREKKVKEYSDSRKETLEHIGGKTSPFWIFMSIIGILAAIGFGIYAAFNAQGAIAGLVDPMGDGILPIWLYLVIGSSISIVGMLLGHLIYEGLADGFARDEYTGEKSPSSKLWLAVVGFIGAIGYIGYQFILVKSAGDGNNSLAYVVAGIAIIELLVGALILHRAFAYLLLFITTILMATVTRQMNASAKNTNNSYRDYLTFINVYNRENPANQMQVEGNDNIRRAIAFYTGTKLREESVSATHGTVTSEPTVPNSDHINRSPENESQTIPGNANLNSFLDDTTDEDLTV